MFRSHFIVALCASFCFLTLHMPLAHAIGTWETTLQARDLDSNPATVEAWYDTTLQITWLANANLAASNSFGLAYSTDLGAYAGDTSGIHGYIYSDGVMNWPGAKIWIDALNASNSGAGYLGYNGWRLPTMLDTSIPGCDFGYTGTDCGFNVQTGSAASIVYSEMASMFYDTLGNLGYYDTSGVYPQADWGLANTGSFDNIQSFYYWFGLEAAPNNNFAWQFNLSSGSQNYGDKTDRYYGWAVHPGDIGAAIVPLPAAVWLFGGGLVGLAGVAGKRRY